MDRRKALAVAGTVAGILLAAGGALAANFGLLSTSANADPVGQLPASLETVQSTTQPQVTIVYQDVYDQGDQTGTGDGNGVDDPSASSDATDTSAVTPPASGGDQFSDDDHESDDSHATDDDRRTEGERDDDD